MSGLMPEYNFAKGEESSFKIMTLTDWIEE